MLINGLQARIDHWIKTVGIRYFDTKTNMLLLMEEVGELSRLIARTDGEQSFKKPISKSDVQSQISDEIADALFVLVCLANQHDIDLTSAIYKNLIKKSKRDRERHQNNPKLSDQ